MKYAIALLVLFTSTFAFAGEDMTKETHAAAPVVVEQKKEEPYLIGALGAADESDATYAVGIGKKLNDMFAAELLLGHFGQVVATRETQICQTVSVAVKGKKKTPAATSKVCRPYFIEEKDGADGALVQAKLAPLTDLPLYVTGGAFINNDYISPTLGAGLQFGRVRIEWRTLFDAEGYNKEENLNSLSLIYELR